MAKPGVFMSLRESGVQEERLVALQEGHHGLGCSSPVVTAGRGDSEKGIFAVPVPADDFPLWILPCLDAEELFREGCGDSLRFFCE